MAFSPTGAPAGQAAPTYMEGGAPEGSPGASAEGLPGGSTMGQGMSGPGGSSGGTHHPNLHHSTH